MMKVLLGITLLCAAVHSAAIVKRLADMLGLPEFNMTFTDAPGIRHKRYADKPDVTAINQMRRAVARAGNIPNMPDLEWDEQLVAVAKDMPSNCNDVKNGHNYRYLMDGPNDNALKMVTFYYVILLALDQVDNIPLTEKQRIEIKAEKRKLEQHQDEMSFMLFELFNPAQTKIGCAQSRCDGVLPGHFRELANAVGMSDLTYSFEIMCAIGPNRSWNMNQMEHVEYAVKKTDAMKTKSFVESSGSSIGAQLVLILSLLTFLM